MCLILLAGINTVVFHLTVYRNVKKWDDTSSTPPAARAAAWISLTLWAGVVFAGRGIAYY